MACHIQTLVITHYFNSSVDRKFLMSTVYSHDGGNEMVCVHKINTHWTNANELFSPVRVL